MRIGYAYRKITPALEPPAYLAGFGRNRPAKAVHDDLGVRVLALDSGPGLTFLAVLDLLGLGRQHCREVEAELQERFPDARLILCCTHTHHGPDPIGFWGPNEGTTGVNAGYLAWVKGEVVLACKSAAGKLTSVSALRSASVEVPGIARNYRDPGVLDIELACLQFCNQGGDAIANLLIYPCHPEVLSPENEEITSDYPDVLRREVEQATGAPALFFAGALGGMMSPSTEDRTFQGAAQTGKTLAQASSTALLGAEPVPIQDYQHLREEFSVPLENPVFQMAVEVGLIPEVRDTDGKLATETNLLRFGETWLVTVPGELFPILGLELKAQARSAGARVAAVIGLANDELGYIMPEDEYVFPENPFEPGDHYEETMSVGAQAGPRLMDAVQNLLGA